MSQQEKPGKVDWWTRRVEQREIPLPASRFEEALLRLGPISEFASPLRPCDIDLAEIRTILERSGLILKVDEVAKTSLAKTRFRELEKGRGPGVLAVFGGNQERLEEFLGWCREISEGGPTIGGHKDTEGRGLRQFTADLLQLAVTQPSQEEIEAFCLRTNQRVVKGFGQAGQGTPESFTDIPTPEKTFSSVVPGSIYEAWLWLQGRQFNPLEHAPSEVGLWPNYIEMEALRLERVYRASGIGDELNSRLGQLVETKQITAEQSDFFLAELKRGVQSVITRAVSWLNQPYDAAKKGNTGKYCEEATKYFNGVIQAESWLESRETILAEVRRLLDQKTTLPANRAYDNPVGWQPPKSATEAMVVLEKLIQK